MEETLSTLAYASEARKIKNRPVQGRDKDNEQLAALRVCRRPPPLPLPSSRFSSLANVAALSVVILTASVLQEELQRVKEELRRVRRSMGSDGLSPLTALEGKGGNSVEGQGEEGWRE